jgi:hypothetical protein
MRLPAPWSQSTPPPKRLSIKTADGTVKVVKVSEKQTVDGLKAGANYTALGAEKGAHVVVKYTGEGADATATGIKFVGKDTVKASEGTVAKIDEAAKTVSIKTAKGTEEVYHYTDVATSTARRPSPRVPTRARRSPSTTPK